MIGRCTVLWLSTPMATAALATAAQDRAAMSDEEDRAVAARAAESPGLEDFSGGWWSIPAIIILCLLFAVSCMS